MATYSGTVLIVDDDAAVRSSLKFALELEGLVVRLYEGGRELLADESMPRSGCLVVDYFMPAMTGVELVDELHRRQMNMPAILITSKADADIRRRAANSGFRDVLEKPLSDGTLVDRIRAALVPDAQPAAPPVHP